MFCLACITFMPNTRVTGTSRARRPASNLTRVAARVRCTLRFGGAPQCLLILPAVEHQPQIGRVVPDVPVWLPEVAPHDLVVRDGDPGEERPAPLAPALALQDRHPV